MSRAKTSAENMLFLTLLIIVFLPLTVPSTALAVIFNELAWMGTTASANDEWIELYNNTDSDIDMNGWKIIADDNVPNITLSGIIPGRDFYLLERTNDQTIPEIAANQIYAGALENSGENLRLINKEGILVDEIKAAEAWPAGDNSTKQTMERINPSVSGSDSSNWQTSENPGGTPKAKNSEQNQELRIAEDVPPPTFLTESKKTVVDDSRQQTYSSGIVINEILPSPEGADEIEEWIEIYNQNDFPVDLSNWQISDSFGQTKTHHFPENSIIFPKSYLVIKRPDSGIILNNQEEKLVLSSPDKQIVDSVYYKGAVRSQSFARFSDQWFWTKTLTPGSLNIQSDQENKAQKDNVVKQKEEEKALLAARVIQKEIKQGETKEFPPLKVFGLALLIAGLSGTAILMLKRLVEDNKLY